MRATPVPADSAVSDVADTDGEAVDEPVEPTVPAEPTRFDLVGSYRATSPQEVTLPASGLLTGALDLAASTLRVTFAG